MKNNKWLIYKNQTDNQKVSDIDFSDQYLISNKNGDILSKALYEDEGGPLSLEDNELDLLIIDLVQNISNKNYLANSKVTIGKNFLGIEKNEYLISRPAKEIIKTILDNHNEQKLPGGGGSIPGFIFCTANMMKITEDDIKEAIKKCSNFKQIDYSLLRQFDLIFIVFEGWVRVITDKISLDDIKFKVSSIAEKYGLEECYLER